MRHAARQKPYETYCFRCRVSYPAERRRCIHCGERLGVPEVAAEEAAAAPTEEDYLEEEEIPRRRGVLSPVAILWLVLAVAGAIFRTCTGQD